MWRSHYEARGRIEDTGGRIREKEKEAIYILSLHALDSCVCC
jgi:hypothetical protein